MSNWKKSSYSMEQYCLFWKKSTKCESHTCVEVAGNEDVIYIADSKLPEWGTIPSEWLVVSPVAWKVFTNLIKEKF